LSPVIVTIAPTGPLEGLKIVIVGAGGVTVKSDVLVPVCPATVTDIAPVVAPVGTEVVILVAVDAVTTAVVPLNLTVLFAGVASKLVPVIVTLVPSGPLVGVKLAIVGVTIKLVELVAVCVPMVTTMGPVVAPVGTVAVMLVEVDAVTEASVPLNVTVLFPGIASKFVPVIVTLMPASPPVGLKLVIAGGPF